MLKRKQYEHYTSEKPAPGGSTIKNLCAAHEPQEPAHRISGSEGLLEKGMATHSSVLAGKFHGQRSLSGYSLRGRRESDATEHTHACRFMQRRTHKSVFQILPVMLPIVTYVYKHILKNGTYCSIWTFFPLATYCDCILLISHNNLLYKISCKCAALSMSIYHYKCHMKHAWTIIRGCG